MIIFLLSTVLCFIGLMILGIAGFLFVEIAASLFQPKKIGFTENQQHAGTVVLVPAHNEQVVIQKTLQTLQPQLQPKDKILVIADNCSDATADIARSLSATVLERHDDSRRGKGYALDFGLRAIANEPPNIVIVIDADCIVQVGALNALQKQVLASGKPAQAVYLMEQPNEASPKDQISAFAFKVKNLVRPLGLTRFELPCPLTGTGMAFPWSVIAKANLASGNIVEDMKLGVDLAIAGYPTLLCPDAKVLGQLPSGDSASTSQRTRWEHGHLQTLLNYVPQLFWTALQKQRLDLALMAVDLAIPPLALLVMLWLGSSIISLLFSSIYSIWLPSIFLIAAGLLLFTAILIAWGRFGRDDLPLQRLLSVPFYILWKIPLYFKFLIRPQNQWIRTERESSSESLKS